MTLFAWLPSYALSAEQTVKKFYDNVASKRCFDAVKLRPDYSLDSCENIDKIYLHKVVIKAEGNHNAVALVELDVEINSKSTYFLGHTLVKKNGKKWLIVGPYKSEKSFSVDEYIAEFIPQGLNAASETKKAVTKKPKAAKARELPPGDAVDASSTKTVITPTRPTTPTTSTVDNVSSIVPDTPPKKLQQLSDTGSKPLQHNREMDSYFLGSIAIEGNFMGLLDNIHALFPDLAQHIMLIDKSQSILYLYKENKVLAGFFPVLTTDINAFPSGLYQIGEAGNETKTVPQTIDEGSITLKKLELGQEQQLLISDYYYLRNYFDKNQKQSLSLSPIDNSKLQQLITEETLVYIAE